MIREELIRANERRGGLDEEAKAALLDAYFFGSPENAARLRQKIAARQAEMIRDMNFIAPAETLQADEPVSTRHNLIKWALWATAIALVGAHPLWVRAGMPVPSFLTPVLENINV